MKQRKRYLFLVISPLLVLGLLAALLLWWRANPPLPLWSVAFSPDGKTLVTGGGPDAPESVPQIGEVIFWDAVTGRKQRVLRQQWAVRRAVFSPDGTFVVTSDFGGKTRLIDAATGRTTAMLTPQFSQVNAIGVSADGKRVAGGSFDGGITLWDPAGKETGTLQVPNERILDLAFSPDSQWLVAGCREGRAFLLRLGSLAQPRELPAYVGPPTWLNGIEAVAFAPDGRSFATGGMLVRLWQTADGSLLRDMQRASGGRLNRLAFSPDGSILAGVDRDGWLRLWNPATGEETRSVQAHAGSSFGLAFSGDGARLATVDRRDFAVKIWDPGTLQLVNTFRRARVGR